MSGRPERARRLAAGTPWLAAAVLVAAALPAAPPDPLRAAAAAALLVALGSFGLRLAGRLLDGTAAPGDGALGRTGAATLLTAGAVFGTAGAVLPATLLGAAGHLRPGPFLLVVAGLGALAGTLPPVRLLPRQAARAAARPGDPAPASLSGRLERAVLVAALAAVALVVAAGAWHERWVPPRKLDDPSYHLATVALWTHTHDLRTIKFDYGDPSTAFYPLGGELIAWALVAPLRDGDFVARWSQLLYGLLSFAAVVALAHRLGVSRRSALLAAVLWASVPRAFPALLYTAGNDHSTGLFAVALVDALLLAAARPAAGPALYAGAALGLLVGTKYLGLLLAAPLLGLAVALGAVEARHAPPGTRRRRLVQAGLAGAAAAALGGYTYLRNLVVAGNPVFPAPVELFGIDLPGWQLVTLEVRRHLPEFPIDPVRFLLRGDLFGEVFPFVAVTAAVFAPLAGALTAGTTRERLARAGTFALPAAYYAIFLGWVHDHRDSRYLFAAIALAAVAAGWLIDRLSARGRWGGAAGRLAGWAVGLSVLVQSVRRADLPAWQDAVIVAVLVGIGWLASAPAPGWTSRSRGLGLLRRPGALPAAALLPVLLVAAAGGRVIDAYRDRQLRGEPIADRLDRETRTRGVAVAYLGYNAPYPFAGARLQNRVEIVPAGEDLEGRHFDWNGEARLPFDPGSYPTWLGNLERLGVEWIVVDRRGHVKPEHDWMRYHQGRFRRVEVSWPLELWRLERPAGASPR